MPVLRSGIDEAGYGPLLGPLAIAAVSAEVDDGIDVRRAFRTARVGVKDSKELHTSGDLAPLESVALGGLAWLLGDAPATAADLFALLGEHPLDRDQPWMAGAEALRLPVAAAKPARAWRLEGVRPRWVGGALIHPAGLNRAFANGVNRAELELGRVGLLLLGMPALPQRFTTVDRLGGRRYYGDFLQRLWPGEEMTILGEAQLRSGYRVTWSERRHEIEFCVGGEAVSPLTALASCIAKYARELAMHLFNDYWCSTHPGLVPTAGYGTDAHRWLNDVGAEVVEPIRSVLVRGQNDRDTATATQSASE